MRKKRFFPIILAFTLVLIVIFAVLFCLKFGKSVKGEQIELDGFKTGKLLQSEQVLGQVARNIPSTLQNEGKNSRYPMYDHTLSDLTDEEKDNILAEDALLRVSETTYDSMDEFGNLYLNGAETGKKLYKHTASVGMYLGDVSDSEPAVIQRIDINVTEDRNYITGLYAPAGEIVKIEISQQDLDAVGGSLMVCVGQVSHRNINNNIWKARDFNRMPNLGNKWTITTTTSYVGNYLGGPIYVYSGKVGVKFSVTISGAVRYPHYIHGYTTKEELEEMKSLTTPYFDFEISDLGVRHSGSAKYANLDYDNLVKVGDLWEKICRTSRQVPCSANASIGVGFVYDCFVAAGSACAFQGGHSWVNAPCSWLSGSLDYEGMTKNGFWGQIHEFNHLYQSYGMHGTKTNEVTNNATSLLSYVLYTNISSTRSENDSSLGGGWNRYTDPTRSLRETIANAQSGEAQFALNAYADIIHSFGVDVFTNATRLQTAFGVDYWYEALSKATGYNMTFYFEQMLHQTISDDMKELYDKSERTTFVPIACLYQTGRDFYIDGEQQFIETVRPYEIEEGETYYLDFDKYIYVPQDFTYKIKKVTTPSSGTIKQESNFVYSYKPSSKEYSGTFKVVVELMHSSIKTKDVTLTINLKQRVNNSLNVTKYIYPSAIYDSVDEAINADFAGYTDVVNSSIDTTFLNGINNNQIGIVEGKVLIKEDGEYAICLRSGRGNNTLYLAVNDVKNLQQVMSLTGNHPNFALDGEHVIKMTLHAGDYLYFKEITLSKQYDAYTEIGMANLTRSQAMSTVSSNVLYNNDVSYKEYDFVLDEKYTRQYQTSIISNKASLEKQSVVEINFSKWDDTTGIQNIFDGTTSTFYHNQSGVFVSDDNPFILKVDLGEELECNQMIITARDSGKENLPCSFKLYGGMDLDSMMLLGEYNDLAIVNKKITADFKLSTIRYYYIYVTDTKASGGGNKYVSFAEIDFVNVIAGKEQSPLMLNYFKKSDDSNTSFIKVRQSSTFGHVVQGNGVVGYTFEGKEIAFFANQSKACKILVIIDGKREEIVIDKLNEKHMFLHKKLSNRTHEITIIVLEGDISIDSFITN